MRALAHHGSGTLTQEPATRRPLTRAACLIRLAPGGNGRVAATMRAVPIIIPVRFALVGDDIVFTVAARAGLARAVADSVIAFETDHIGPDGLSTWDVHVTGVARTLGDHATGRTFCLSSEIMTGS